ncbi:uncharacterized protein BX663DRAFT_500635 [Cokeromyces recurvatus]|uniref:uncharacterized protein n=1 Tax=Cokeromyces recurvatus TaxID=90255 RepID=UPI0022202A75|nr:uncharacterized protein BX663DRAFT_500635 [Cokeromyces recurvatus]KAI7905711.1 hypothetical protein BX663DRAFT_500635 [Cokeromyces recurvatus]
MSEAAFPALKTNNTFVLDGTNSIENKNSKVKRDGFYHSPMSLLALLETFQQSDHKHVFKSFILDNKFEENKSDMMSIQADNELIESVEIMNNTEVTRTTRIICQTCHVWFTINHTKLNSEENRCSGLDYPCHHYHAQGFNVYQCCGCDYTVAFELQEPLLPIKLLERLEATRPKARSYAELMQQNKDQPVTPTLVTTYSTLLVYLQDLLKGIKRNINKNNPHFLARVGLDDGSQALLEEIGFQLEDNYFLPPDVIQPLRLEQIEQEILLALDVLRQELGSTTVPFTANGMTIKVKTADMQHVLGIISSIETRYRVEDDYVNKAYTSFGLTSGASDRLVEWTYKKLMNESIVIIDEYEAIDHLVTIANYTNSTLLQTLIACERSKGKIGRNDIGDAYAYFGVLPDTADDRLLIGLYQIKMTDEPLEKNTHQDKLKTIAIARHSSELIDFLKKEKGIPLTANIKSVEDILGVPAQMINSQQTVPVGLNNIGNTCYFNSLLQYYNTFIPFRETMIHNELFVEDENSEPKKIGGINVDQSEIRRAKKFVNLLKELFLNLQQSQEKAISPQYDLAYMALLNKKEDDEDVDVPDTNEKNTMSLQKTALESESSNTIRPHSPPPSYDELDDERQGSSKGVIKERPSVDTMMFGKQQDVTECMSNVMYLVEAALKPLSKTEDGEQIDDMIRRSFYGKARQILSYRDNMTQKIVKKEMEEDFSHVIVDASEGKDLYDGLDEYFFADQVENFQGGCEVTREVTAKSFPPILQILVQRVQFDRATANIYKSNAYIQFYKTIYLDRYADENFEALKERRAEVALWRMEMEKYERQVAKYTKSEICKMPIPDLLEASCQVLEEFKTECPTEKDKERLEHVLDFIKKESKEKREIIQEGTNKIQELRSKIHSQYDDYNQIAYRLHAVFIHQGQANYGHYWIYILDHKNDQWWKYNDSLVTKVQESEIFHNTTGSTANPYFLVYVDESKMNDFVETIVTRKPTNHIIADAA